MQLSELITDIMLKIIEQQPDPREREAMLEIMRKDGHLPRREEAA